MFSTEPGNRAPAAKAVAKSNDDPGFVRLVSLIIDALVIQRSPKIIVIIAVDNWFDHKWLNFSGKILGALGVWKDPLTIPPFHPDRIINQTVYQMGRQKQYELMEAPPLHNPQSSAQNLKRKIQNVTNSGVFAWWSGNTRANAKGSFMAYIQNGDYTTSWYASFDRGERWTLNKTKNISTEEVRALLQSGKPGAEPNAGLSTPSGNTDIPNRPASEGIVARPRRRH